jgi:hypothetical protein
MARATSALRQRDVARVVKALLAEGLKVTKVEVEKDGKFVVCTELASNTQPEEDFDKWKQSHASST